MTRALLLALLSLSCAGRAAEPEPPRPTASTEGAPEPEPDPVPPPIVEAEPPPEPAPAVTLAHEISRYGVVTLSLSNRSEGSTRVALRVTVERDVEGESVAADDLGAFVVSGVADGSCAELVSGGELQNSWACLRGDASASDRTCTPAPNGTYRFVATSCDGRSRTEGEAFTYPP